MHGTRIVYIACLTVREIFEKETNLSWKINGKRINGNGNPSSRGRHFGRISKLLLQFAICCC